MGKNMSKISPLAPDAFPEMPEIAGVRMGTAATGESYIDRDDLLLASFSTGTRVAGVLTASNTPGEPVKWCRRLLKRGRARGLVVNSGNANVFTGRMGEFAVARTAKEVAKCLDVSDDEIFVASTGVIGEQLDYKRILSVLPSVSKTLKTESWLNAAKSIMTTDTFPKGAWRKTHIDGYPVNIAGIAKGSGMIAPNMATMLAFLFTDARLPVQVLNSLLKAETKYSFNSITVDGDTSTSDTCLLFATGQTRGYSNVNSARDIRLRDFHAALGEVMLDLSHQIVRDGEGATKFITIKITGARSEGSARRVGLVVLNSPLVKTAIAGEDPNWGRLVMAVGRSGEKINQNHITIRMCGYIVARNGKRARGYNEEAIARLMKNKDIEIEINLSVGDAEAKVWGCDLTHRYVEINTDYRS